MDREDYGRGERSLSHLFPKEASYTECQCAADLAAQAEQSNEHDEKQDDVGDEGHDDVKFAVVGVEYDAGWHSRVPVGAELQIHKVRRLKVVEVSDSPVRYLTQCHVCEVFSIVCKKREERTYHGS